MADALSASIFVGETVSQGTSGSVLFIDTNGHVAQHNAAFSWDDTNFILSLTGNAGPQLKLSSGSRNWQFQVDTSTPPNLILTPSGSLGGTVQIQNGRNGTELQVWGTTLGSKYLTISHSGASGILDTNNSSLQIGTQLASSLRMGQSGFTTIIDGNINFYNTGLGVAQGTGGENVTNNVTNNGSINGTIPDITDGVTYANDYVNLRRALFQIARMLGQDHNQIRAMGILT